MQITSISPIAVRPKSDQLNSYEVDVQVEWFGDVASALANHTLFSVVSVPLVTEPGTSADRIATEGLRIFRAALDSTTPSDVRTTLELEADPPISWARSAGRPDC
jgi:hypothetical protein